MSKDAEQGWCTHLGHSLIIARMYDSEDLSGHGAIYSGPMVSSIPQKPPSRPLYIYIYIYIPEASLGDPVGFVYMLCRLHFGPG